MDMTTAIGELRQQINELDAQLVRILEQRDVESREIGGFKKENGLPVYDPAREEEIIKTLCAKTTLPEKYIRALYKVIFEHSRELQNNESL